MFESHGAFQGRTLSNSTNDSNSLLNMSYKSKMGEETPGIYYFTDLRQTHARKILEISKYEVEISS
jgi:hypothetical protein